MIEESRFIFFAVPLVEAAEIIGSYRWIVDWILAWERKPKRKLIVDLTWLKTDTMQALRDAFGRIWEILWIHNMYRPWEWDWLNVVKGKNFAEVAPDEGDHTKLIEKALKGAGWNLVKMSAEEHDQTMSVLQGLTHFTHMLFVMTVKDLWIDINKLNEILGKVKNKDNLKFSKFAIMLTIAKRILAWNGNLYFDMQHENHYFNWWDGSILSLAKNSLTNILDYEREETREYLTDPSVLEWLSEEEIQIVNTLSSVISWIIYIHRETVKYSNVNLEFVSNLATPVSNPEFFIWTISWWGTPEMNQEIKGSLKKSFYSISNMVTVNNKSWFARLYWKEWELSWYLKGFIPDNNNTLIASKSTGVLNLEQLTNTYWK